MHNFDILFRLRVKPKKLSEHEFMKIFNKTFGTKLIRW